MGIPEELKKLIRSGDHSLIAEMYAEIHSQGDEADHRTVTSQYVGLVLEERRPATPGTAAEEIEAIAIKLLEHRRNFIDDILTVDNPIVKIIIGLLMMFLLTSCNFNDDIEYKVDERLQPYVDKFFEEAASRGLIFQKYNLVVSIQPKLKEGAGLSRSEGHQRVVVIDQSTYDFLKGAHESMEVIVFHELGHALLYRNHCDTQSIMNPAMSLNQYAAKPEVRKIIVDELFTR